MNKFQTTHKVTTKTGIEQEESLLSETAARETSLNSQILDLENDLNKVITVFSLQYYLCWTSYVKELFLNFSYDKSWKGSLKKETG